MKNSKEKSKKIAERIAKNSKLVRQAMTRSCNLFEENTSISKEK